MTRLRDRLSYANVMATIAVFLAFGGAAFALSRNSVKSRHIAPDQVRASDLDNLAFLNLKRVTLDPTTNTPTLLRHGPIRLKGACETPTVLTGQQATIRMRPTVENVGTVLGFKPSGGVGNVQFVDPSTDGGLGAILVESSDSSSASVASNFYTLFVPGGKTLHGFVVAAGNVPPQEDGCIFLVSGFA